MPSRLSPVTRRLVVLCAASLLWAFSFGLGAPLASLWLQDHQASATAIGLNTSVYYLGIVLAAGLVPWQMRTWRRRALVAGMIASGVTVAAFPWADGEVGWTLLRLFNGFAGAMSLIPLEALVNFNAPSHHRSRDFGCYAFCVALGWALGTLVGVELYPFAPSLAFTVGGLVTIVGSAGVALALDWPDLPPEPKHAPTPLEFRRNLLGFGSAWGQGFLEGGMVGLLPIYLRGQGLAEATVGWVMSGIMLGVLAFLVPVSWLADRLGRARVLLGCYAVTAAALVALITGLDFAGLVACLFLAGACSSSFYPLGLSLLGERLPGSAVARANAWFLGINCVGSLIGPLVAGATMDHLGRQGLFTAGLGAVVLVVLAWAVTRGGPSSTAHHPLDESGSRADRAAA